MRRHYCHSANPSCSSFGLTILRRDYLNIFFLLAIELHFCPKKTIFIRTHTTSLGDKSIRYLDHTHIIIFNRYAASNLHNKLYLLTIESTSEESNYFVLLILILKKPSLGTKELDSRPRDKLKKS